MVLLCLLLVFDPTRVLIPPFSVAGYQTFTLRFCHRMERRLDARAIRAWLDTLDEAMFDGQSYDLLYNINGKTLPLTLPKEITRLDKHIHYLRFYKKGKDRYLRITWGGPYGHWGVVIGPENMEIPPTVECHYNSSMDIYEYGEYRIKLEDGVYVWHEIQ